MREREKETGEQRRKERQEAYAALYEGGTKQNKTTKKQQKKLNLC